MRLRIHKLLAFMLVLPLFALDGAGQGADMPVERKPAFMLDTGGHSAAVTALYFTPDGERLISVAQDSTIRIWDLASGTTIRALYLPMRNASRGERVHTTLSGDGRLLAAALGGEGEPSRVLVIALDTGTVVRTLKIKTGQGYINELAFSPDGKQLAVHISDDRVVRLCNAQTGAVEHELKHSSDMIRRLAFSPDGQWLAVAELCDPPYRVSRWSTTTGKPHPGDARGRPRGWMPPGPPTARPWPPSIPSK